MDLNYVLIRIGYYLRKQHSTCHYNDYVNVFKARFGSKISIETITRRLRKLRERGIFFTPPFAKGQFFLSDRIYQNLERMENG